MKQTEKHIAGAFPRAPEMLRIAEFDSSLLASFSGCMFVEPALTRKIVSFQDNKSRPFYRLFKYKEAFSAALVEYLLSRYRIKGPVLDCFAGAGTALFSCAGLGLDADGIDILPSNISCFEGGLALRQMSGAELSSLAAWKDRKTWSGARSEGVNTLRISARAYPPETEIEISKFFSALQNTPRRMRKVLLFALISVLESVSYTRKDGQFLRWDNRSGRDLKNIFNKGRIPSFSAAVGEKISGMMEDAVSGGDSLFAKYPAKPAPCRMVEGSCLEIMPAEPDEKYGAVITSPPYCNRYDYTRTYALELALLGTTETELSALRQSMLSCTVENRPKNLSKLNARWGRAVGIAAKQPLLNEIVACLRNMRGNKQLNNNGIPRMVEEYFKEMACVIWECFRVLKPGGKMLMVNDNVRYGGINISADLILSDIARRAGFRVSEILVLPRGKGNSSQQMGEFGRSELRKCVYFWEKP